MKSNEIWKDIPNYEGLYQVSSYGNVKSLDRKVNGKWGKMLIKGKLLSLVKEKDGYYVVNLYKNHKTQQFRVHRLVAEVFIPNPNNLPEVNHKNEDKTDNKVDNLEFCTTKYNCNYGNRNRKIRKRINQYDLEDNFIKEWESIIQIERELNIFHSRIIEVCRGRRNQIGGYIWKYVDEI